MNHEEYISSICMTPAFSGSLSLGLGLLLLFVLELGDFLTVFLVAFFTVPPLGTFFLSTFLLMIFLTTFFFAMQIYLNDTLISISDLLNK